MKKNKDFSSLKDDILKIFDNVEANVAEELLGESVASKLPAGDPDWIEEPCSLQEFVVDILGEPPLTDLQLRDIYAVIGEDPKKIFTNEKKYNLGVLAWAKGGGKNYCIAKLHSYLIYVVLCMRSPFSFLGLPETKSQHIDFVNVAKNSSEASRNFFDAFKRNIKLNKLWRDRYAIYEGDKLISGKENESNGVIRILLNYVSFPKQIRCFSYHSQAQSYEGLSPLVFVADEFSSFNLGAHEGILDTDVCSATLSVLRTSASTRFGLRWVGFVISYLRHQFTAETEPTYSLIRQGEMDPDLRIYGVVRTHWDLRADLGYAQRSPDTFFTFEESYPDGTKKSWLIPVEFKADFKKDARDAKAKFLGILPTAQVTDFFQDKSKIDDCVVPTMVPLFRDRDIIITTTLKEGEIRQYVGKELIADRLFTSEERSLPRVIHVDASKMGDRAVLMMASFNPQLSKVVVDLCIVWEANLLGNCPISNSNIEDIVAYLNSIFNVVKVTGDSWQPTAPERMNMAGVDYEISNVIRDDYVVLRAAIYEGMLQWYPIATHIYGEDLLSWELKRLVDKGHKVEKRLDSTDDCADALAGVVRHYKDMERLRETFKYIPSSAQLKYRSYIDPVSGRSMRKPVIVGTAVKSPEGKGVVPMPYRTLPSGIIVPKRGG